MKRISEQIIGCAYKVSNELGAGFLESVYENALCVEFDCTGLSFERQKPFQVFYREQSVGTYVADLIVSGNVLVELKALSRLAPGHDAQVLNYLRASRLSVGILLNFGTPKLGIRRLVWRHNDSQHI